LPELPYGGCDAKARVDLASIDRPAQRGADVVEILNQWC
jgi:hypothetical protein